MKITLQRYSRTEHDTLGMLLIDGEFQCYTLEDEKRTKKVKGETRIPAGTYRITLRREGGFHGRYSKRFGSNFHKGMLWLRDVPGFEWILVHVGNTDKDTAGCILVGTTANNNRTERAFIGKSVAAYKRIYPMIADALTRGEEVKIQVRDEEVLKC